MQNKKYALIGNGRLATHIKHYLSPFVSELFHWHRSQKISTLHNTLNKVDIVLIAINDDALETFIQKNHELLKSKTLVHFSGSKVIHGVQSAHPLMSFSHQIYEENLYPQIHFILEKNKTPFKEIFPFWDNPHHTIESSSKTLYHSLCVIAGNFTTLLWQEVTRKFKEDPLQLPKETLDLYQQQIFNNIKDHLDQALTGPLVRKDYNTISEHKTVLNSSPELLHIYESFERLYNKRSPQ